MISKTTYGSLVWFIATLFVIYSFCLDTASAVFSENIKSSLHIDNLHFALASGSYILGFAVMQIPAGYLLDKFNAKYVLSLGVLILALGNLITFFSHHLFLLSLSNFIQGIGSSFSFVGAAILIAQWFTPKSFPILFGLTQTLSCIFAGLIHYEFILLLQTKSWNEIYKYLFIAGLGLFILVILFIKTPRNYQRATGFSLKKSFLYNIKNKQILLCTFAAMTSFGILLSYASFWYLPIQKFYAVNDIQSVIISGLIFTGIGIGTPLLGWLSNRLQSRMIVIHVSLTLGAMMLLLGVYLPHFKMDSLIIIKIISFLIGLFLSGSMLFYTMVSEISSNTTRGVALSILNTFVFLLNTFMLLIPYLFITQFSTQFFTYLWILPFFILISILLLCFIKDTYHSSGVNS